MMVEIDDQSPLPPYEQLRRQITGMITAGTLEPGTRLPPIRQLAGDLDLAPGTVARTYRELEAVGLVTTGGRRGTRVTTPDDWAAHLGPDQADRELHEAADRYATLARQLGVPPADAIAHVRAALRRDPHSGSPVARSVSEHARR